MSQDIVENGTILLSSLFNEINQNGIFGSCQWRNGNASSIMLKDLNMILIDAKSTLDVNKDIDDGNGTTPNANEYDSEGALLYIVFILLFYSISVVLMIIIQTKKSDFYYLNDEDESDSNSAQNVLKRIRSKDVEREALEDLKDARLREKLWGIYTQNPNNYKIRRHESKRLHQIDRKLKQYYMNDKGEYGKDSHYKTFDYSQLDRKPKTDNLILLKDYNKIELNQNTFNSQYSSNMNTMTSNSQMGMPPTNETSSYGMKKPSASESNFSRNRFKIEKIVESVPV